MFHALAPAHSGAMNNFATSLPDDSFHNATLRFEPNRRPATWYQRRENGTGPYLPVFFFLSSVRFSLRQIIDLFGFKFQQCILHFLWLFYWWSAWAAERTKPGMCTQRARLRSGVLVAGDIMCVTTAVAFEQNFYIIISHYTLYICGVTCSGWYYIEIRC